MKGGKGGKKNLLTKSQIKGKEEERGERGMTLLLFLQGKEKGKGSLSYVRGGEKGERVIRRGKLKALRLNLVGKKKKRKGERLYRLLDKKRKGKNSKGESGGKGGAWGLSAGGRKKTINHHNERKGG